MDDAFRAYRTGRADGMAALRDRERAAHPETGADYRIGFLDGRLEVFRMHTQVRRIVEESDDRP
jgi:hypothetical protein